MDHERTASPLQPLVIPEEKSSPRAPLLIATASSSTTVGSFSLIDLLILDPLLDES